MHGFQKMVITAYNMHTHSLILTNSVVFSLQLSYPLHVRRNVSVLPSQQFLSLLHNARYLPYPEGTTVINQLGEHRHTFNTHLHLVLGRHFFKNGLMAELLLVHSISEFPWMHTLAC